MPASGRPRGKARFLTSVTALYAAVVILALAQVAGVYVDSRSEAMQRQRLEVSSGLEKMMRLGEQLNNMLLITVLDQNILRTSSYDTVDADLRETVRTLVEQTGSMRSSAEIAAMETSIEERAKLEAEVISLVRSDSWAKARGILFGDAYMLTRKTNEIDIETAVGSVMGELSNTADLNSRVRSAALVARLVALALLVWIGIAFSRRAKADLGEQVRLRTEIESAKEALEERVRERTADLEDKTRQLASENEERLRSEARTRLILKSAGEGIIGVDIAERVTFFNDAAGRLLGFGPGELIGKAVHETIHHSRADGTPYPREDCPMHLACSRGSERHEDDDLFWRRDGSSFQAEYSIMPIADDRGTHDGAVIVFRDITGQKEREAEMKNRLEELERFNRITVTREERMIELKLEINRILESVGRESRYRISE